MPGPEAERVGRLGLAARRRRGCRRGRSRRCRSRCRASSPRTQRHELGLDVETADEVEALEFGKLEGRAARRWRGRPTSGRHDEDRQADQERRERLPGRHLPAARPDARATTTATMATAIAISVAAKPSPTIGLRQEQTAIAEVGCRTGSAIALPRPGQHRQHRPVPEQELQQHRDVAERLDIDRRDPRDEPVLRQPRDAGEEAEDRGEHDADDGDEERVEQADEEGAAVGDPRRCRGSALCEMSKPAAVPEEVEARGDVGALEVVDGVVDDPGDQKAMSAIATIA